MNDTDTIKSIHLDVAYGSELADQGLEDALADMLSVAPDVYVRISQAHGPGGGWPEIEFRGPDSQLRAMLREKYGADGKNGESVAFYMGEED